MRPRNRGPRSRENVPSAIFFNPEWRPAAARLLAVQTESPCTERRMKTRLLPLLLAALAALVGLAPTGAWARHPDGPPPGRVIVFNQSGGTVTVAVSGQSGRTLTPWQTGELWTRPGEVTVRATYVQFGAERTLQSDRVYVAPGRATAVTLAPEDTARVLVTNQSRFQATLLVDGKPVGSSFLPGEARVVATRLGPVDFAMTADGRTLERARLTMRAFEEPRWIVDPPVTGDLLVVNPLPIPIQLVCDKGLVRTVAAYGQTTYANLPMGTFRLTARRTSGEYVDAESNVIRPGATSSWRVDAPRTGFVSLDSDHFLGTEIRVDGKRMATLAPGGATRVEAKVGWHEVMVLDDRGRVVLSTWIEVEPFDVARLSFGTPAHVPAYDRDSRDGRYDRRDRDGQVDGSYGYGAHDDDDDHDDHRDHDHGRGESCGMP